MLKRLFLPLVLALAMSAMVELTSCTQTSSPASGPSIPATTILDSGSVMTFIYSVLDSSSLIRGQTYRVQVDSLHRSIFGRPNVSVWNGAGSSPAFVNYGSQGIEVK